MTKAKKQHHRMDHKPFLVVPGKNVNMADFDPGFTAGFENKDNARAALLEDVSTLRELQERLWACADYAILIILQGMDASGKDGTIKHVMSGVNPQGCNVYSFKAPSEEERRHHFLWRPVRFLPGRGRIAIFNRSYYEEVGVVRVHPELLEKQWIAPDRSEVSSEEFWKTRFEEINAFEEGLTAGGTIVLKFFLHLSRDEQRKRLIDRLTEKDKLWKYSPADYQERAFWDEYVKAYEDMLGATSTKQASWYVIPADHKWFTRACVADIIASRMQELDMKYPSVSADQMAGLQETHEKLLAEERGK